MAISTGAKIAIGGAAALAAYFLLAGTSNAAPVDPHVAGHNAGCADGTRDAKAGQPPLGAADVTGSATISAAAKASGDAVAYLDGYMTGYNECYSANAPSKVTPGPAPAPKPKPKPGAPPGADKPGAMDAYGKGCFQGAHDGYDDGLSGRGSHAHPADYPSGNPAAFAAGYRRAYSDAYSKGHFGYQAAVDAGFPPDDAASAAIDAADPTYPDIVASGCDGYFDGWWASTSTGGIEGFFRRIEVGGIALVGARRAPMSIAASVRPANPWDTSGGGGSGSGSPKPTPVPTGCPTIDVYEKVAEKVRSGAVSLETAGHLEAAWQAAGCYGAAAAIRGAIASREAMSGPKTSGFALVGDRRPRRVAQRLMPAIAVPKAHPLGWPAPPPGSSRIYRSYE